MDIDKRIEDIKQKVLPVIKHRPINKAGIFGSVLRNDFSKSSDIDILVDIDASDGFDLLDLVSLKQDLKDTLGRDVDLVDYNTIKPFYKKNILESEIRIYEKN